MKKVVFSVLAISFAIFGVYYFQKNEETRLNSIKAEEKIVKKNQTEIRNQKVVEENKSENYTVKMLVAALKEWDDDYINQYLNYPDRQRILAEKEGGFSTFIDPDYAGPLGPIYEEGKQPLILDTRSKDATTVGEVKAAIRQAKSMQ